MFFFFTFNGVLSIKLLFFQGNFCKTFPLSFFAEKSSMSRLSETIPHGKCTEISSRKSSPVQITNLQHMRQGGFENEEPHSHDTQWREKISYVLIICFHESWIFYLLLFFQEKVVFSIKITVTYIGIL